jgi:hypothetical protein
MTRKTYRYCADPECCATLVRKPSESSARFAVREHCDIKCANRHKNHRRGQAVQEMIRTRSCPHCRKPIVPADSEKLSTVRKRVRCGRPVCVVKQRALSRRDYVRSGGYARHPRAVEPSQPPFQVPSGMTPAEAIAAFLAERGATRCPTAAVAATTAQPSPADTAALVAYRQAEDARRAARTPNFAWGG